MHAALGDHLFAFVERDQLTLDPAQLGAHDVLDYAQALVEAYLRVHPAEEQRVGRAPILTVLLRALDTLN
jgi:hypothetical protein